MLLRFILSLLLFYAVVCSASAQNCTALGQKPTNALTICGLTVVEQESVPLCRNGNVSSKCGFGYGDLNPFWYKFTCYSSGTIGFIITPRNLNDDYDWQLFDVTGKSPNAVYFDTTTFVACSWSAFLGKTGADPSGTGFVNCAGPDPLFTKLPHLEAGHQYLLLVSHYTSSQSGYRLAFTGYSTANITDNTFSALKKARAACDGSRIVVSVTNKVKCNSLTSTGSEFSITPALANVVGAYGFNCTNSFEMDSMMLILDQPLPPGNYTLTIGKGTDNNTLLTACDKGVPEDGQLNFTVGTLPPFAMDSIINPGCAPKELELYFKTPILPTSVATNGSDFIINGSQAVSIIAAEAVLDGYASQRVVLHISAPILSAGNFTLTLRTGTDGNTILDECGRALPVGSSLTFVTKDTVNADFNYTINYGCQLDTISYRVNNNLGITDWKWIFDNGNNSIRANPQIIYSSFGERITRLRVSNGVCSDTASVSFFLKPKVTSKFETTELVCPGDPVFFKDRSIGNIVSWLWDFGNMNTSQLQTPPVQHYSTPGSNQFIPVSLRVTDTAGCSHTSKHQIELVNNCYVAVPSAFTPNSDGLNDFLYPINAYKALNLLFRVYNRQGQLVFESRDRKIKWDGRVNGQDAEMGTYVWILNYVDKDSGNKVDKKGTTILLR